MRKQRQRCFHFRKRFISNGTEKVFFFHFRPSHKNSLFLFLESLLSLIRWALSSTNNTPTIFSFYISPTLPISYINPCRPQIPYFYGTEDVLKVGEERDFEFEFLNFGCGLCSNGINRLRIIALIVVNFVFRVTLFFFVISITNLGNSLSF